MNWTRRLYMVLFLWAVLIGIALHQVLTQNQSLSLRILHTNDHHAHLEAVEVGDRMLGGIAQRKSLIDQLQSQSQTPTLLLDAGDIFQGTLYFNQYLGLADLPFYNELHYAAVAIGNHEFDETQETLAQFIRQAQFPMLSANLKIDPNSPLSGLVKPWIIQTMGRQKIGIFGLTTEETPVLSSPGEGVEFIDEIAAAQQAVTELQQQGVNKIIALTHIGFTHDLDLAEQVSGIDIVIGGHSHTPLGDMPGATQPYPVVKQTPAGKTVLVATDWEWGKYLGDLAVDFDRQGQVVNWKGSPHAVDSTIPEDATFQTELMAFKQPLDELRQQVIGQSKVKLEGDRDKVRTQETNLGNLITDALMSKMQPDNPQIVMVNGGGIRASIPAGEITLGQVIEVLPFGNTITRLDLTGAQIKQVLEHGVSEAERGEGAFPQVSGVRFAWNPKAKPGSRITSIKVKKAQGQETELQPNATYRVVTNNFMMQGGDGYEIFKQGKDQVDTGYLMADVVADYIRRQTPISITTENRIIRQGNLS